MAAKVSAALRQRILDQRKEMGGGGVLIRTKDFDKATYRILPCGEDLPGVPLTDVYSKALNKGTTSPVSFGVACPVMDVLDRVRREGSKEEKDFAFDAVTRRTKYVIAVVARGDEGTPDSPRVRCFPCTRTVYQRITGWMVEDDIGEDITDPEAGSDIFIKREGTGLDTEWVCEKVNSNTPISEDPEMAEALIDLAPNFDIRNAFYPVKVDVLNEIYGLLTDEEIPEHYLEEIQSLEHGSGDDDDEKGVESETETVTVSSPSESGEFESGDFEIGDRVTFEEGGKLIAGTITEWSDEDEMFAVHEDGTPEDDDPWWVTPTDLDLLVEEAEPSKPPKKKKVSKKKVSKKKVSKKTTSKVSGKKATPTGAAAKMRKRFKKT